MIMKRTALRRFGLLMTIALGFMVWRYTLVNKSMPEDEPKAAAAERPEMRLDAFERNAATKSTQARAPSNAMSDTDNVTNRFVTIAEKVILSAKERAELNAMLSSSSVLNQAAANLLVDPRRETMPPSPRRLRSVGLIEAALTWQENPAREELRQLVRRILFCPNLSSDMPETIQRSIAGDKFEIYSTLLRVDRSEADVVYQEARTHGVNLKLITAVRQQNGAPID